MAFGGVMRGIIFSYVLIVFGLIFTFISEWLDSGNINEKKTFKDFCFTTKLGSYIVLFAVLIAIPSVFYFLNIDFKTVDFYFLIAHICPQSILESRTITLVLNSIIIIPPTISLAWTTMKNKIINTPTRIPLAFNICIIVDLILSYIVVLATLFN